MSETGLFDDECKRWRKKDPTNRSWANFKTHFTKSHEDLQYLQKTGISTGYHAKLVETNKVYELETLIAIKNIVNMSIEDRKAM